MPKAWLTPSETEDKWRFRADGASENKLAPALPSPLQIALHLTDLAPVNCDPSPKILFNEVKTEFFPEILLQTDMKNF